MLLVIGLDGATFNLINPWLQQGHLPTLKKLINTGVSAPLESTMPPVTAAAWASFMTGKNPGQHSVFDFFKGTRNSDNFELVNRDDIIGHSVWDYLSQAEHSVGILNVPVTHPPRPVNGYLVPGLLSPDQGHTTYPPTLLHPYQAHLGPYRLTPSLLYHPGNETAYIADLLALIETQIAYMHRISQDYPTDFLMVHFLAPDIAQHALWKHQDPTHPDHQPALATQYKTAIRQIYTRLDTAIGNLLKRLPTDTTTIVMSDHGFGPLHHTINLNNFFIKTKLMSLKRTPSVQARALAFKAGIGTHLIKKIIKQLNLQSLAHRLTGIPIAQWPDKLLGFKDVDWKRTVAYSLGHMGQVYLNLKGREPLGCVAETDYEKVRQQVINKLQSLTHPLTNQPLVNKIILAEAVANGPYLSSSPDLHIIMDNYQCIAYPMFAADGNILAAKKHLHNDSGTHRQHGIFIAAGPALKTAQTLSHAHITDLAPTILHLMGVPIPTDMSGQVLTTALKPEFMAHHPISTQPPHTTPHAVAAYSDDEQAEVEERLRSLGYLG